MARLLRDPPLGPFFTGPSERRTPQPILHLADPTLDICQSSYEYRSQQLTFSFIHPEHHLQKPQAHHPPHHEDLYLDYLGHFVRRLALSSPNSHRHQPLTVVGTNCGFYAGVTYMVKIKKARHCRVSIQVTSNLGESSCQEVPGRIQDCDHRACRVGRQTPRARSARATQARRTRTSRSRRCLGSAWHTRRVRPRYISGIFPVARVRRLAVAVFSLTLRK